jgi:hypothetical protein
MISNLPHLSHSIIQKNVDQNIFLYQRWNWLGGWDIQTLYYHQKKL